jgi:hypothetical protein
MTFFYTRERMSMRIQSFYSVEEGKNIRRLSTKPQVSEVPVATLHQVEFPAAEECRHDLRRAIFFATPYEVSNIVECARQENALESFRVLTPSAMHQVLQQMGMEKLSAPPAHNAQDWLPTWRGVKNTEGQYRLAAIAPFGPFGDTIIFLTALRILHCFLANRYPNLQLDLFQEPLGPDVLNLYKTSGLVDQVFPLPQPLERLSQYDGFLDFTDEPVTPGKSWLDALLEKCGICGDIISPEQKRNQFSIPEPIRAEVNEFLAASLDTKKKTLFFHPLASTAMRSMPEERIEDLLQHVTTTHRYQVVSSVKLPVAMKDVHDLSGRSNSIQYAAAMLQRCDRFLSVDTAIYHIADGLRKPGLVLFTSIPPEDRLKFYPQIKGIRVFSPGGPYANQHAGDGDELRRYAKEQWMAMKPSSIVELLETCQ